MIYNTLGYVRKDNRLYEKKFERIIKKIRKIFLKVHIEFIEKDVMLMIPNFKKYNKLILVFVLLQIKRYIKKHKIKELIIENDLNYIKKAFKDLCISDGKLIMKKNIINVFEYINHISKKNMNLEDVYVLVNEYNNQNNYLINQLVENFKIVNIITENITKYRKIENSFYKKGILITVSNNKRKSLRNAKYIINVDFDKNKILLYNIKSDSIIINLCNENIELKSTFNGVLINNIELKIDKEKEYFINEYYGKISKKEFIETIVKKNINKLEYINKINQEYDMKISGLIGVRGRLENNEFLI